ncbi:MAG TPA: PAS domain S-box protein, partial [Ignavibacteriaceae bacterium]
IVVSSDRENLLSFLGKKNNNGDFHFRLNDGRLAKHKLYSDELDDVSVIVSFKDVGDKTADFKEELINRMEDAVIAVNKNLEIIAWNKAAEKMYGWTETEALGQKLALLMRTETTEAERRGFLFDLETKGSFKRVITGRHKNGTPVFIESNTISVHDSSGKISGYVSVNRDISSRLETLEKLRRSEERYRKIFDENPLSIFIYRASDYSILKANKSAELKYQYSAKEFERMKIIDLLPADDKGLIATFNDPENRGKMVENFYSVNKSGERIFIEYTSSPITYEGSDARLVEMNDITDKQKVMGELFDSSSKLATIIENMPIILIELNEEGKFVLQKGRALAGLKIKPDELVGQYALDVVGDLEITQRDGVVIPVNEAIRRVLAGEVIAGHTTTEGRYFENYFVPVRKEGNNGKGVLGISLDITERVNFEKSFHNTEERFRLIAENTSDLIAMVAGNEYIYISPSYEKILGFSIDEIKNIGPGALVHPDDRPVFATWRESGMIEFRVRNKKGEWLWIEGESFLIPGDPEIIVGIASDITKRKLAEEKLRESEEKYRMLFERNPLPMFVYDEETYRYVAVNEVAIDHYGYSKEEFLQMTVKDIRPEEDINPLMNSIAGKNGKISRFGTWRHRKKNGTVIDVEVTTHRINFNGRKSRIVLANDITEKVRAERAMKQSEAKYRIIVENADEGILLVDRESRITVVNTKLADIIGYTPGELENRSVLGFIFEEDLDSALKYLSWNREGRRQTFEFKLKHKDGSEIWANCSAVPIFDESDSYAGGLALITDITQQRKAEKVLQRTNEMLRALIDYSPLSVIILDKEG